MEALFVCVFAGDTLRLNSSNVANVTINMPVSEAPCLYFSAPCLIGLTPNAEEVTALPFFGQNGEFNSLTDLSGKCCYNSIELMKVVSPEIS